MIRIEPSQSVPINYALIPDSTQPTARLAQWGGWLYAPTHPTLLLRHDPVTNTVILEDRHRVAQTWDDPLEALDWMSRCPGHGATAGPPFKGGWIGWLSYDLGRLFETIPTRAVDDLKMPLFEFVYFGECWARQVGSARDVHVWWNSHPTVSQMLWRTCEDVSQAPTGRQSIARGVSPWGSGDQTIKPQRGDSGHRSNMPRDHYEHAVQRALDYIAAGDIFQVNLSQRLTTPLPNTPEAVFHRAHQLGPPKYGAFLHFTDYALISLSPELFLRVTPNPLTGQRRIITRPIKGTRPRSPGMDTELLHSIKDQAELNMIVDLERNDLGRVCQIGSVKVTEPRTIESHPTVYHGVATVEGTLRNDVTFVDLLRATFPGGSITGAPKIRAMQIIEELEPTRRGPYCGAIGFLSVDGHIELNIAIRTMIAKSGLIHIPIGGAIVADSTPAAEYEETLVKAQAMLAALGMGSMLHDAR